jgi:YVTN family beta-propeller protein
MRFRLPAAGICLLSASIASSASSSAHASPQLYVSCEDEGAIGVIDTAQKAVSATWPAGKRPRGLRLSPDGTRLYVALSGSPKGGPGVDESKLPPPDRASDGIGEFDVASGKRLRILPSGQDPESFDITSDGHTLWVSNEETSEASIVDVVSGKVRGKVGVGGEPEGVRLRPDGKQVYVTSEADNAVFAIDTVHAKVVGKIVTSPRPRVVLFTPDGKLAYISSENGATVAVVNAHTAKILTTIAIPNDGVTGPLPARPMGLALSADAATLYVANGRGGTISVIDTATRKIKSTIVQVGARPWGLALSADGATLYSANGPSNDVSVIDVASGKVAKKIPTCRSPWGLALGR